jgi:hypothetical protein
LSQSGRDELKVLNVPKAFEIRMGRFRTTGRAILKGGDVISMVNRLQVVQPAFRRVLVWCPKQLLRNFTYSAFVI